MSNLNTAFEYQDSSRINDKYTFRTTIMLTSDGCSVSGYCLLDEEYVFLGYYPDTKVHPNNPFIPSIKKLLEANQIKELLKFTTEINFVLEEPRFALIPADLYEESELSLVYKTSNVLQNDEELADVEIENCEHHLLFPVNSILKEYLGEQYPKSKIKTLNGNFLEWTKKAAAEGTRFQVDFQGQHLYISYIQNGTLKYHNVFEHFNNTDALYYIIYTSEQLGLNLKEDQIHLGGSLDPEDELFKMLKEYVANLVWSKRLSGLNLFFKLTLTDAHRFNAILL